MNFLSLTVVLIFLFGYSINSLIIKKDQKVCETEGCKAATDIILDFMDSSVNPCDDFYQFACGGYIQEHPLPPSEDMASVMMDMNENMAILIQMKFRDGTNSSKKAEKVYQMCIEMNSTEVQKSREWVAKNRDLLPKGAYNLLRTTFRESNIQSIGCAYLLAHFGWGRWLDRRVLMDLFYGNTYLDIQKIESRIRDTYHQMIDEDGWIERETKESIHQWLKGMKYYIGYRTPYWTVEKIEEFYEEFTPADKETFSEYLKAQAAFNPRPGFEDYDHPAYPLANANYDEKGGVILWSGMIQKPFYQPDYPLEKKYAGMGFTFAHETTHSLDPESATGDIKFFGNDREEFFERSHCIADRFGNASYTLDLSNVTITIKLNGTVTWTETVSDDMGWRVAYRAYLAEREAQYGKDYPLLPGLEAYTGDQFFCGTYNPRMLLDQALHGETHPIDRVRINEGLKDNEDFARVFQCPTGSPMNPEKKCRVWRR